MDERVIHQEGMPCFYASMVLYFSIGTPLAEVMRFFSKNSNIHYCVYDNCLEITICEVKDIYVWEAGEVLTKLFAKCDLDSIKKAIELHKGSAYIDISFTHEERFPVLIFEGEVMQIIRDLRASVGIDPY